VTHNFSQSQQAAYDAAQRGENIFITGSGGNGKSYLTRALTNNKTLVVAPTGIAALNVQGVTCHKAFGLPIGLPEHKDLNSVYPNVAKVLRDVNRIIISEVGMLRQDQLLLIDKKLKLARENTKPFGGVQMIVEGDFFQLEPIVSEREEDLFYQKYEHPFAFGAKCWDFNTYELTQPQRHPNIEHYNLLNEIREGKTGGLDKLLSLVKPYQMSVDTLHLCCYNKDAAKVNSYWYGLNTNQEYTFKASVVGKISEKDVIAPETLKLKVGCKVLICANSLSGEYVNGDTGIIHQILPHCIQVTLDNGKLVEVDMFTWNSYGYSKQGRNVVKDVQGSFTQYPLTLGWAISVHKAQGITLDRVSIHTGAGCFSHGQLYVAVSRVKDLSNLSFIRQEKVTNRDLIVREEVLKFYGRQ